MTTKHLLVCALLASSLLAQGEPSGSGPGEAARILKTLEDRVAASLQAWQAEQRRVAEAGRQAGSPIPAISMLPPLGEHVPAFAEAARKFRGGDEAIPFLVRILDLGRFEKDKTAVFSALDTLVGDHGASPRLMDFVLALPRHERTLGRERVLDALAEIRRKSTSGDVRAFTVFVENAGVLQSEQACAEEYAAARQAVAEAAEVHKSELLKQKLDEIDSVRKAMDIGGEANDIAGIDLDGKPFRLSDYKGKIILLSFWGHW